MASMQNTRTSDSRNFDLNIERVLEHWSIAHAIREVIANALDDAPLLTQGSQRFLRTPRALGTFVITGEGSVTSTSRRRKIEKS